MKGKKGKNGQGTKMHGKNGEDTLIRVPCGVVIREIRRTPIDLELGEEEEEVSKEMNETGREKDGEISGDNNPNPRSKRSRMSKTMPCN